MIDYLLEIIDQESNVINLTIIFKLFHKISSKLNNKELEKVFYFYRLANNRTMFSIFPSEY